MPLPTLEESLKNALQGVKTQKIGDATYILLSGLSTLSPSSMRKLILLSADPKHAAHFQSVGELSIEEGFLYELLKNGEIAQTSHAARLKPAQKTVELKPANITGRPLSF